MGRFWVSSPIGAARYISVRVSRRTPISSVATEHGKEKRGEETKSMPPVVNGEAEEKLESEVCRASVLWGEKNGPGLL